MFGRVLCTKLGLDGSDSLLYTENDLGCCVDITSTKDGKFITVNSNSRTTSEEGYCLIFFIIYMIWLFLQMSVDSRSLA